MVKATVWVAAVGLMAVTHGWAQGARPLRERVLEDFDNTLRRPAWQVFRSDGESRIAVQRVPEGHHAALALRYAFTGEGAQEVGLRIDLGDLDASEYDHLRFRVKGDTARGFADSVKVEFRRPQPPIPGLYEKGSFVVEHIGGEWREVTIPLNFMTGIAQWTHLDSFVVLLQSRRSPVKTGGYVIDDIRLVTTGERGPSVRDPVMPVRKRDWEASLGGVEAARPYIRQRLAGWPRRLLVDRTELPQGDEAFLRRLAQDTWRGLAAFTDRDNGLPIDNVHFGDSVKPGKAHVGDYTNITNVGLYLAAIVAAEELGLIAEAEAMARLEKTLGTLERLETYRGFFFNYYDTTSLERTSNFVSFVDSSWLTAGLMVVRTRFPALAARCAPLIDRGDYRFFYDEVMQHMHHGYYVNLPAYAEYHYGLLYTESRLGSLIAIGKGDVPEEHWFALARTFPEQFAWQTQRPLARTRKAAGKHRLEGGYFQWGDLRFVPSWGGSLFEALMPVLVLDEPRLAAANLGANDRVHAQVQRRYALEELGYPVWGMSPSMDPDGEGYSEYGVRVLGARGYKAGAVTPHASALALAVTPQAAIANLRALAARYDIYGEYGFYDTVAPLTEKVRYSYLTLDQAMLFIAVANHLKPRCVQRHFEADPIAARAIALLHEENFFE